MKKQILILITVILCAALLGACSLADPLLINGKTYEVTKAKLMDSVEGLPAPAGGRVYLVVGIRADAPDADAMQAAFFSIDGERCYALKDGEQISCSMIGFSDDSNASLYFEVPASWDKAKSFTLGGGFSGTAVQLSQLF